MAKSTKSQAGSKPAKHGYDAGLIDKPVRYGPQFKTASKTVLRKDRNQAGLRMFEAKQIRQMIDTAGPQLRAMIRLSSAVCCD